jgi:polyhydroxybutyrate depolymerase
MRTLGLEALARRDGVVLAYPDAVEGSWNDGRPGVDSVAHRELIDDVGFLRAIVADATTRYGVDARWVVAVGLSNGAMMATRLACEAADVFGSVAAVAGVAASEQLNRCNPSRPVAFRLIVSRRDPTVPFTGGPIAAAGGRSRGAGASAMAVAAWWAARAGCSGSTSTPLPDSAPAVQRWTATGCSPGTEVVVDSLEVQAHGWFEQRGYSASSAVWSALGSRPPEMSGLPKPATDPNASLRLGI